jgi:hypothetical protein
MSSDLSFKDFKPKDPSFKFGLWARYVSLATQGFTPIVIGLSFALAAFIPQPPTGQKPFLHIASAAWGGLIFAPLFMVEYPVAKFSKIFTSIYNYKWRGLMYFLLALPCLIGFPMQLIGLWNITTAVLYWIAHCRGEKGSPPAEPKARR